MHPEKGRGGMTRYTLRLSWHWRVWYVGMAWYLAAWQPLTIQLGPLSLSILQRAKRSRGAP